MSAQQETTTKQVVTPGGVRHVKTPPPAIPAGQGEQLPDNPVIQLGTD